MALFLSDTRIRLAPIVFPLMGAMRWRLTPAVSRRAMDDTRRPQNCHWRGRLQCMVRPTLSHRVPCPFPPGRSATGPVGGKWCRSRAVLGFLSWGYCLGAIVLQNALQVEDQLTFCLGVIVLGLLSWPVCLGWAFCLGLSVLGLLSWPVCLGLYVLACVSWGCCLGCAVLAFLFEYEICGGLTLGVRRGG